MINFLLTGASDAWEALKEAALYGAIAVVLLITAAIYVYGLIGLWIVLR